ncbi:efflux RND transporter periplasmic adaptor subunit [Ferrimonas balearica]|uniref:efflux RND transporter periplasmic adaptor subunit n=1 Tax=Ferrimonas balearica TaxID=44012 RepID=UPI001C941DDD|nr:efflux RND transporter periplasmic adaptor subunit [Ferrimonas balearica]MBY6106445.1 efflux RND transporter periplasmic adaptor subunit [Ferrimonas balearica]
MKELLIPYVLICWLLFRFGLIAKRPRNYFIATLGGTLLFAALFFAHRLYSPADLTHSTQVRAPHTVMSPPIGQEIVEIYVDHNERVKAGQKLYRLRDDEQVARLARAEARVEQERVKLAQAERRLQDKHDLGKFASLDDLRSAQEAVELAELHLAERVAQMEREAAALSRNVITATHDGLVTHVLVGEGSRVGALHVYDTSRKFVEMRIADQSYQYIEPGQFAEFYVDAYPGQIFRARVHSITMATGESQGSPFPFDQSVGGFIQRGAAPVGRTVILEFDVPEGVVMPLGTTGSAWISANKPHPALGFLDMVGAAVVRLGAIKSYVQSL